MNKLYSFFLAISVSVYPSLLYAQPLEQQRFTSFDKQLKSLLDSSSKTHVPLSSSMNHDVSYCARRLFEAAQNISDQEASKAITIIIDDCISKGLSDQTQLMNAHSKAVDNKNHLAAWRLATESGRREKLHSYNRWTAAWTVVSATVAVGACLSSGMCGTK